MDSKKEGKAKSVSRDEEMENRRFVQVYGLFGEHCLTPMGWGKVQSARRQNGSRRVQGLMRLAMSTPTTST